jgi:Cof subfamily protein (haloacid dehalogenase superfamily)
MIKALFFDIDGTLVSFKTHQIPQSTVNALEKAKERGIKIFISTGRPVQFITNIKEIEHLIDGYISTNGACCFVGKDIVNLSQISQKDVETIISFCRTENYGAIVVGIQHIGVINYNSEIKQIFVDELKVNSDVFSSPLDKVLKEDILQISPFFSIDAERKIMPQLSNCISGRWHPRFTDITSVCADKGKGLKAIAATQDLLVSECMAFGDGGNDISILKTAGIGVALGNADEEVKAAADYVTNDVDSCGVANALKHFGII